MISDERIRQIAEEKAEVLLAGRTLPSFNLIAAGIEYAILKALRESQKWRDMESAPDDGSPFLARRLDRGEWVYGDCHRIVRDDCEMWYFRGTSAAHHVFPGNKPHQWQPLPPFGPTVDKEQS